MELQSNALECIYVTRDRENKCRYDCKAKVC